MGLDLALLLVVAIFGIRGLMSGFVIPVVKLTALVSAFYLAGPIRDACQDNVHPYFSAIEAATFSKILWWALVFISYIVMAGLASLMVKLADRKLPKDFPGRGLSKAGGLILGLAKGGLLAALVATGALNYGPKLQSLFDVESILSESQATAWVKDNQPIDTVWNWSPVVSFRTHVYDKGWFQPIPDAQGQPEKNVQLVKDSQKQDAKVSVASKQDANDNKPKDEDILDVIDREIKSEDNDDSSERD